MPVCFFFVFMETIGIEPPTSRGNSPQSGLSPRAVPPTGSHGTAGRAVRHDPAQDAATRTLPRASAHRLYIEKDANRLAGALLPLQRFIPWSSSRLAD